MKADKIAAKVQKRQNILEQEDQFIECIKKSLKNDNILIGSVSVYFAKSLVELLILAWDFEQKFQISRDGP